MGAPGSLRLFCTSAVLQPIVTDELIKKLREVFPTELNRAMSHREIDYWIGSQQVINYLVKLREGQQEDPLDLNLGDP